MAELNGEPFPCESIVIAVRLAPWPLGARVKVKLPSAPAVVRCSKNWPWRLLSEKSSTVAPAVVLPVTTLLTTFNNCGAARLRLPPLESRMPPAKLPYNKFPDQLLFKVVGPLA